ncbi:MAG: hypothetical protein MZU97_27015 [Bacillus subtilis]|nr:hypothetical protein [Bacillus subtilis]
MSRLFSKTALSVVLAAALALSLSGGVMASVKATSPLTVAKLVKSGDGFSIVHGSGFSFLLPTEGDLSVYEAKDAYGLRKLYVSSSQGPVIEISAAELDTLTVGPLDGMSMSFLRESEAKASGAIQHRSALGLKVCNSLSRARPLRFQARHRLGSILCLQTTTGRS